MHSVSYTKRFSNHFKKIPATYQKKANSQVNLLTIDFRDQRLHTKKLSGSNDLYSFRVGREYRILFKFESGKTITLVDIRHRKDIYRKI